MTTTTELRELLAKATPGPWMNNTVYNCIHTHSGKLLPIMAYHHRGANNESDAALIVAAVNALPKLLEAAELLREARENIPPHEWDCHTDGLVERIDATIAKLEATK